MTACDLGLHHWRLRGRRDTIPAANVAYDPGTVTGVGEGTFAASTAADIAAPQPVAGATGEVGATTVGWNPTITVTLPSNVVAGTYSGTITHSVA